MEPARMERGPDTFAHSIASLMKPFSGPWAVAGGWSLDLYMGRVTRSHADIEVAIFRHDQQLLHQCFLGWDFSKVSSGKRIPWRPNDTLRLPIHELHGQSRENPSLKMEFLLNERMGDDWVFRRRQMIRLPLSRAICATSVGVPVLNPAIVLLYKSKSPRPKDEADFYSALPSLSPHDHEWLHHALEACHPRHEWLSHLH